MPEHGHGIPRRPPPLRLRLRHRTDNLRPEHQLHRRHRHRRQQRGFVDVGGCPGITVSPDGKQVYVSVIKNFGADPSTWQGHVVVLDTTNNNAVVKDAQPRTIRIGTAFSKDGKNALCLRRIGNIHVFDTATTTKSPPQPSPCRAPASPQLHHHEPRRQHRLRPRPRPTSLTNTGPVYKITGSTANQKPTGVTATPVSHDSGTGATTYQVGGTDPDGDPITYTAYINHRIRCQECQRHVHLHTDRPRGQWHRQLLCQRWPRRCHVKDRHCTGFEQHRHSRHQCRHRCGQRYGRRQRP